MKLKYVVGSPNCRKVHAVIDRLGLSVDFEYLDFFTGDLRSEGYAALNPNAMVPTLVDDDFTLWESNAINVYLASGQPTSMYPDDPRVRADITRWLCWELAHYNRALGALSFETVAKPVFLKMQPDAAVVEIARRDLQRFLPVLERHLRGRRYMVGDEVTLADYAVAHLEGFKSMVPFDWAAYSAVNAFYARIADDPHWGATTPRDPQAVGRRPS
jgi:glutathione S-transferase